MKVDFVRKFGKWWQALEFRPCLANRTTIQDIQNRPNSMIVKDMGSAETTIMTIHPVVNNAYTWTCPNCGTSFTSHSRQVTCPACHATMIDEEEFVTQDNAGSSTRRPR